MVQVLKVFLGFEVLLNAGGKSRRCWLEEAEKACWISLNRFIW